MIDTPKLNFTPKDEKLEIDGKNITGHEDDFKSIRWVNLPNSYTVQQTHEKRRGWALNDHTNTLEGKSGSLGNTNGGVSPHSSAYDGGS
ncbi:hypothetical protein Tco_0713667 [Tanacetum coccineum]